MSGISTTTDAGTTVSIEGLHEGGDVSVFFSSPDYPGESVTGGVIYSTDLGLAFRPDGTNYVLGPPVLRALADLLDSTTQKETQP